ncbi:MAG TPA: hypothetical protein DCQ06_09685 [Myxococcales bacterium]|nr:hypothetical protein [Myxococcales bacterium]|tara:strand:+ start:492 stop:1289 length:798 start_codon:yes stop_codon:yes gene_type:complete
MKLGALLVSVALCAVTTPAVATPNSGTVKAAMGALELAKHHYKRGNFKKAAKLFLEAYSIHPNTAFLFNAGRAQQRAFKLTDAEDIYRKYLKAERKDQRGRSRASMHIKEIQEVRAQLKRARDEGRASTDLLLKEAERRMSQPTVAEQQAAEKPSVAGWATTITGSLVTIAGIVLVAKAEVDAREALDQVYVQGDTYLTALSSKDYQAKVDSVDRLRMSGGIAIGIGAVATIVGAFLIKGSASKSANVSWMPRRGGGVVQASIGF